MAILQYPGRTVSDAGVATSLDWPGKDHLRRGSECSGPAGVEGTQRIANPHRPCQTAPARGLGLQTRGTQMESSGDVTYWGRRRCFPGDWGAPARSQRKGHPRKPLQPLQRVGGALKPQGQSGCPVGPAPCCDGALANRDQGGQMLGAGPDPRTLLTVTPHASPVSEPSCSPPHPGVQGPPRP